MAFAETVTGEVSGQIDKVDGVATRMGTAAVGHSFTVLVTFDTAGVPRITRAGDLSGARYYFKRIIQTYGFRLASGPTLTYPSDFSGCHVVTLRDNFWDTVGNNWPRPGSVVPFKPFGGLAFRYRLRKATYPRV